MTYKHGPEELQMIAFFDWVRATETQEPRYKLFFHCPNERKASIQRRITMARAGVRKGIPDICYPVPNHTYTGLFIEMKVKPNKPSKEQLEVLEHLKSVGAYAVVCWSASEAIEIATAYTNNTL
jgi:hypothetical protein